MEIRSDRVAQTIEMLQAGTPAYAIKEALGYANNNAIYNIAKRYGLQLTDRYELERKEKSEIINALYEEGLTTEEVIQRSGYSYYQVVEYRDNKYSRNIAIFKTEDEVSELTKAKGFEYIGGYNGADSKVIVRCITCGAVTERGMQSFNRKHAHARCESCYNACRIERETERKNEIERQRVRKQIEKDKRAIQNRLNIVTCNECGEMFIADKCSSYYCSERCKRRARNRKHQIKKEERRSKIQVIDNDITLDKLYDRDKGICYLCGRKCKWDDSYWKNGVFYAGNEYPSIEHVVPISNGGEHSWDNIKLAHRLCNSIKGDRI